MRDDEWIYLCREHFKSADFEQTARDLLRAIREASEIERPRVAAQYGGFLRRERSHARVLLAGALMRDLAIEPTQHVASMIMLQAFDMAASTAELDRFALPGRDASVKHMDRARAIVDGNPLVVARYALRYLWFCDELKQQIARLRGRRPAPSSSSAGRRRRAKQ